MSKSILKRLGRVEKKLAFSPQDLKSEKQLDDIDTLLQMNEYLQKQEKMTMTPEEIRKNNDEASKKQLENYGRYLALSPEEQKRQDGIQDLEIAKVIEQSMLWLNSEERKQFDLKYAEYESSRFDTAK